MHQCVKDATWCFHNDVRGRSLWLCTSWFAIVHRTQAWQQGLAFFFLYIIPLQDGDEADDDVTIFPAPDIIPVDEISCIFFKDVLIPEAMEHVIYLFIFYSEGQRSVGMSFGMKSVI